MNAPFFGGVLACIAGILIALLNDVLTRKVLKKRPALFTSFYAVRQLINVAFLCALYFLSRVLPWGLVPVLIGGAVGMTVATVLFSMRLSRKSSLKRDAADEESAQQ